MKTKTKTILTVICFIAISFTSCQKDEMDHGTGAGGGTLPDANSRVGIIDTASIESLENEITQTDSILNKDYLRQ